MPDTGLGAAFDLGLGNTLSQQTKDQTEEEKKRRRLGLAPGSAAAALFGYGRAGVAPVSMTGLGVTGGSG